MREKDGECRQLPLHVQIYHPILTNPVSTAEIFPTKLFGTTFHLLRNLYLQDDPLIPAGDAAWSFPPLMNLTESDDGMMRLARHVPLPRRIYYQPTPYYYVVVSGRMVPLATLVLLPLYEVPYS